MPDPWTVFPPRQITGNPMYYYGYVGRGKPERNCCLLSDGRARAHRGAQAAERCAARMAARLNQDSGSP